VTDAARLPTEAERPLSIAGSWWVCGVGSPHGDDQAGWLLARAVAEELCPGESAQNLRTPSDLLLCDELPPQLLICDACRSNAAEGTLQLVRWPSEQFARHAASGSHDLDLLTVLSLLERLGRLPPQVWLATVQIGPVVQGTEPSAALLGSITPATVRTLLAGL
jgi:hydrogenase maturation protease